MTLTIDRQIIMKKLKIGSLLLENNTVMAPLAGITNLPFRLIAKSAGCGLVCSEMISSNGLIHKGQKTLQLLNSRPEEKPLSIQIFGSDPDIMSSAASMVEARGADIIDINFGCSVRKVLKTGAGSALMKEIKKAELILKKVRKSVSIPFTIKIRSGWDNSGIQAMELSKVAEACGVDGIAVHPRTAIQGFRGHSDWKLIAKIKNSVSIPVIGNGDIVKPEDALRMVEETGCDGVMVGRAAIGNPEIFLRISALFKGEKIPATDFNKHFQIMFNYMKSSVEHFGEETACRMMRSRLGWFVKGLPGCSNFRKQLTTISSKADAEKFIADYKNSLQNLPDFNSERWEMY